MSIHHTSLYNTENNKPESRVLKQELITYEQTEFGLKICKLERSFTGAEHTDSYTSVPIPLMQWDKSKWQVIEERQQDLPQMFNDKLTVSNASEDRKKK